MPVVETAGPADDELRARIAAEVQAGAAAFRKGHRAVASGHLFEAVGIAKRGSTAAVRRDELLGVAMLCHRAGFDDLHLIALVAAIAELEVGGEIETAEARMFDVAGVFGRLGNFDDMQSWNQRALDESLAHGHHAHAASASTNLATIAAGRGELERATELARASLSHLEHAPLPYTEAVTRSLLVRIAAQQQWPADEALALARPLFGVLRDVPVSDELRADVTAALDDIARRHLAAHPELDGAVWKRDQLPALWGDMA